MSPGTLPLEVGPQPDRARLDSLLSSSPAMLYIRRADGEGVFTFVSDSIKRQLGYEARHLVERPEFWPSLIHPDDRPSWPRHWKNLHHDGSFHAEYRVKHAAGPYIWVRDEAHLIYKGAAHTREVTGYWADISRQKRAEELRARSEERLELIARATTDAVWDWNLKTNEMWWNEAYHTLFGLDPEREGNGLLAWSHRLHPDDRDRVWSSLRKAIATRARTCTERYRFRRGDDTYAEVLARGHVITDPMGEPVRLVGALVDVSEQMALQEKFFQSQKLEAIGQLAGGIAHDFNNILTAIMGYSSLLEDELPEDHPNRSDAEEIRRAAERASALTRQLLAFSRRQTVEPRSLDLNKLIIGLQPMLTRLLGEQIKIELRLSPENPFVTADPSQIEQMILNLSVNARDAMPGGGLLTVETSGRDLMGSNAPMTTEGEPGLFAVLSVSDEGVGMTEEVRERLFEPFFTTKEVGKGTGLGLATCHAITKRLNGFIRVESELDYGSTFHIFLPRSVRVESPAEKIEHENAASLPKGSENILLVEDEEAVRELIAEILMKQGYTVWTAQNGAHAQKRFREHLRLERIDLLITDVVMPEVGGVELAGWLRDMRPKTKVIFCSGYMDHGQEADGSTPKGTAFLQKPFSPHALIAKVRDVLDRPQSQ